jgi:uncharacterized membrane protein (DUF2068 family)
MNWELRSCARAGHATFRPLEPELADHLHALTPAGESWRCLRCGDFVPGPPGRSGPASEAPVLLRGRALRDAFILRLLAAERFVRGLLVLIAGILVVRFRSSEKSLQSLFDRAIPAARPLASVLHVDLDHSPTVEHLRHLLRTNPRTLTIVAIALFGYAAIEFVEAVGLWLLKRWGEYVAVVATAAFIPLEVYELVDRGSVLKAVTLAINIAAVIYLVWTKRLFGARGGHAAFQAERRSVSLLEVEVAAGATEAPAPA